MNAGQLIREVRQRHNLSQEALAIRAATTSSVIAGIESGGASPTLQALTDLLRLMGEDLVIASEKWETGIDATLNQGNLALSPECRVKKGLEFADFVRQNRAGGAEGLGRSLDLGPLLCTLVDRDVDFVVVGSVAGLVHGSAYPTYDLDLAYGPTTENVDRIASALGEIGQGCNPDLADGVNFSFETPFGTLDLLGEIPGIRDFEELRRLSRSQRIAGISVQVASLDHLIAMKRASSQRKDQLMAMEYVELAKLHKRKEVGGDS